MPSITGYQSVLQTAELTILSGQTTSDIIDFGGTMATGLIIATALTGTELSFSGSSDGTNFYTLRDEAGGAVSLTLNTTGIYNLNEEQFVHCRFLKIVSNASEAADRTITIIARPL